MTELGAAGANPCVPSSGSACLIDDTLATTGSTSGKSGYLFKEIGAAGAAEELETALTSLALPQVPRAAVA